MVTSVTPVPEQQHMPRAQARVGGQDAHVRFDLGAYIDSSTSTTQLAKQTPDQSHVAARNRAGEFCCNQQYSVTAITTSTGTIAERYAYSAYGQPTILDASGSILNASAISNRYTYTGREWDATLGLHYFRERWISPSAGRFLSRDPIGFKAGTNHYRFIRSRALRYLDPMGHDIECFPAGTLYPDPDSYDPDTQRPFSEWQVRIWLRRHLSATCANCNNCINTVQIPHGCDEGSCLAQAADIADAVGNTLSNNCSWNPFVHFPYLVNDGWWSENGYPIQYNERYKGYWCWRWAEAFQRAIRSVNASCFNSELEFAGFIDTGRIHVWVKITSKCSGAAVYVDDSFGNSAFGNFEPPCGDYPYVGVCFPSGLPTSGYAPTPYGPDMKPVL
jgi:RHS repeat-associated protein